MIVADGMQNTLPLIEYLKLKDFEKQAEAGRKITLTPHQPTHFPPPLPFFLEIGHSLRMRGALPVPREKEAP